MQNRRSQLGEGLVGAIAGLLRWAIPAPAVKSSQPKGSVNRKECFLRRSDVPRLRQGLSRSLWLSLVLALLLLGTSRQGYALPNPLAGTLEGGRVTTDTAPGGVLGAGGYHTCSHKSDGTVVCWGLDDSGQTVPPSDTFSQVSVGFGHACGVRSSDSTLVCWGYNEDGRATPPSGTFSQVSASVFHTCAIRSDGTLVCWGSNFYGESTPPSGTFVQISAAPYHTCGIKSDGTVACWGYNEYGQATPPSDTFSQVIAGTYDTCGLKNDGTLVCWGVNYYGPPPPNATFNQVSLGMYHVCGVKSDGTLACWGYNNSGQATPPSGTFSQVSAGLFHTCGVRNDGTLTCWGSNLYGQAPVLSLAPSFLATGLVGDAYSQSLTLTDAVYLPLLLQTFILTAGSLPPGLTLSTIGMLSGTPTSSGTFSFTVYGEDANGFTATQNYTLTIDSPPDTTPPVITPTVSGTLGNNGWYTSTVNVTWSVVDNESPVTMQVGCETKAVSTDTAGITFTCQATSTGGASSRSVTIKRDTTAPVMNPTVTPNPVLLNGSATANPNASDALSGLASAQCDPVTASSVGLSTVSCMATDNAGNGISATGVYLVKYRFLGFLSPLPQDTYKVGSTLRVKFRLGSALGTPISDTEAQDLIKACRIKVGLDTATGCASYDARTDTFQFDIKITKDTSVGTHQVVVEVRTSNITIVNTETISVVIR